MPKVTVKLTLIEEALGMLAANPDIHKDFIASRHPDGAQEDETAAIPTVEEELQKSMTIFPRDADGCPIWWDYQIKGLFKDACRALMVVPDTASSIFTPYTLAKPIDGLFFPDPRQIRIVLPEGGVMGVCTRPLRADTPKGPRVALASSETVPVGSTMEFEVRYLAEKVSTGPKSAKKTAAVIDLLEEWFAYGEFRGLGQWRNSGKGRYTAEVNGKKVSM
jgi:hypothetical protein